MEALHDVVKAGKVRYLGASSMWAWRFAKMQPPGRWAAGASVGRERHDPR
jgi:aryl-alcohol dehydrogenase-like predicted oxidoreductase